MKKHTIRAFAGLLLLTMLMGLTGCGEKPQDTAVASCGGAHLQNEVFAFFYWMEYASYVNSWAEEIQDSQFDPYAPLAEQIRKTDDRTWQRYFEDVAMDTYHRYQALISAAEADKEYTLSETYQAMIDAIDDDLLAQAQRAGYTTADELLENLCFDGATVEHYRSYFSLYVQANAYYDYLRDSIEVTDEIIQQHYAANGDAYLNAGADSTDNRSMIAIRDILVVPIAEEADGEITDTDWTVAGVAAQTLLEQYQAGETTEEAFATLAQSYSDNLNTALQGGLQEHVFPGQYDTEMDTWLFDEGRKAGDTAVLRAGDGWHVVYYLGQEGMAYWYYLAATDYAGLTMDDKVEELMETYPLTRHDDRIQVGELKLSTD